MEKLKNNILELFFPSRCAICNKIGTFLCDLCSDEIVFIREQTCPKCNRIYTSGKYCPKCRRNKFLVGVLAAAYFKNENTKILIHELKYRGYFAIAPTLAQKMADCVCDKKIDYICFVPISKKRLRKRGYNQSEELARALANILEKPLLNGLHKIHDTKSQVGLKKKEREANLLSAFEYRGPKLSNKHILLVDDVKTTGTTLESCAKELKSAGAKEVWGLVFAKE